MLKDYDDIIEAYLDEGLSYRVIAKNLELKYNFKVSYQAIGKYIRKKRIAEDEATEKYDTEIRRTIYTTHTAAQAFRELKEKGYDLSYHKVLKIKKEMEGLTEK